MRISDVIEEFITDLLQDEGGTVEIKRNMLACKFNCVPSQINYVIQTRFTPERGYIVESKRGGGGSITIKKIRYNNKNDCLMHIVNSIGDVLNYSTAQIFIRNLIDYNIINEREGKIMQAALSTSVLGNNDMERAAIIKNMLLSLM